MKTKNEIIKRDLLEVLADLPELCYSRQMTDGRPVILKRGVVGYWPAKPGTQPEDMNERMDVNVAQEQAMVCGSMCGFDVPGADPLNYTEPTMYAKLEADRVASKAEFAGKVFAPELEDGEKENAT